MTPRLRFKIPLAAAICQQCHEARLSTNGYGVVCGCGAETDVTEHGKEVAKFARQVRLYLKRTEAA